MRLTRRSTRAAGARGRRIGLFGRSCLAAAGAALLLSAASPAAAAPEREVSLSIAGGYRVYNEPLGLGDDAAILFRVGLGLSSRAQLAIDYLYSDPSRPLSHAYAHVDHARLLGRVDVLPGRTRPYGLLGVGVFVADYSDTYDVVAGTVSTGFGIERRLGRQLLLHAEATAEFYRAQVVRFDSAGRSYGRGPRTTEVMGTFSGGIGFHF